MIAIINYGAGNTRSVQNALKRLGYASLLTQDPKEIQGADKVIFPGVGHATPAIETLHSTQLASLIPQLQQPVLGICLGMQLLCSSTEESPLTPLGHFPNAIKRFSPVLKVPHMGWNSTQLQKGQALFKGLGTEADFYFVHSYYAEDSVYTAARCQYGSLQFSVALVRHNFYALQFHPEKSGDAGAQLLQNFLDL